MSGAPDGEGLRLALAGRGMDGAVRAEERLAIFLPRDPALDLTDPARRAELVRLAREHGFTHLAVEIPPDDAPVRGG